MDAKLAKSSFSLPSRRPLLSQKQLLRPLRPFWGRKSIIVERVARALSHAFLAGPTMSETDPFVAPVGNPGFDINGDQRGRIIGSCVSIIAITVLFVFLRLLSRKLSKAGFWVSGSVPI